MEDDATSSSAVSESESFMVCEITEVLEATVTEDSLKEERPPFNLSTLVGDDTYGKLKQKLLSHSEGEPQHPSELILTNRLLLQLFLLKNEGNKTFKDVSAWFTTLFPSVSYPADRLRGVLVRRVTEATKLHKTGADLSSYLQETVDFDFVSPSLCKLGVKRGQLLDQEPIPLEFAKLHDNVSNQVIVDLEKFRSKERLVDSFTSKWIKRLTGTEELDKDLDRGIKQVVKEYFNQNRTQRPRNKIEKLCAFLSSPFSAPPIKNAGTKHPKSEVLTSALRLQSSEVAALAKAKKTVQQLKEENARLKADNAILTQVDVELSHDKMNLLKEVAENEKLKAKIKKLENVVCQQREKISALIPNQLRRLKTTNVRLRVELQALKEREKRYQDEQLKTTPLERTTDEEHPCIAEIDK